MSQGAPFAPRGHWCLSQGWPGNGAGYAPPLRNAGGIPAITIVGYTLGPFGVKFPQMAHVRAVGLLVLLSAVPAVAESVTIELTPQGTVWLWLHAADRAMAESLGTALGRSLGCTLSDVTESPSGGEWVFHAHWHHIAEVRKLYRTLLAWKNGVALSAVNTEQPEWGLPALPGGTGTPYPNQLPMMAAMIAVGAIGASLLAGFPIVSEATLYFALVWTANVLWDLFGHRFVARVETTA